MSPVIPPTASFVLYEHAFYQGRNELIRENIPDLTTYEGKIGKGFWNDRVSSMVIHGGVWEFWTDIHYSGQVYSYGPGMIGYPPNDVISSIKYRGEP